MFTIKQKNWSIMCFCVTIFYMKNNEINKLYIFITLFNFIFFIYFLSNRKF